MLCGGRGLHVFRVLGLITLELFNPGLQGGNLFRSSRDLACFFSTLIAYWYRSCCIRMLAAFIR